MLTITMPKPKSPLDKARYAVEWDGLLAAGDKVVSQTVEKLAGSVTIESDAPSADGLASEFSLSGGTLGEVCRFHVRCVSATADEFECIVVLPVRQR